MKFGTLAAVALTTFAFAVAGCGGEEMPYKPKPAYSGTKPQLPAVPSLPNKKKKEGDSWTIWGASHDLRSKVHGKDFEGKTITMIGYIVKTNYKDAPECAIHKTGKADPADCKAPTPAFWIADSKSEKTATVAVMGWASNFAQIYSMVEKIDKKDDEAEAMDEFFGVALPNPLPNDGAKVKITGAYGVTYTKSTGGAASNPKYGIMTAEKIEYLEKPPLRAFLPGQKIKNKEN